MDAVLCLALCAQRDLAESEIALCQVLLAGDDANVPSAIQLLPSGKLIQAFDGRRFSNPDPDAIVAKFRANGIDLPIDWEHAQELLAPKGQQAPAAGWITGLENRNGELWASVKWTPAGTESLKTKSYRYISPGFLHNAKGEVLALSSAALVNKPALKLQALATARAEVDAQHQENTVDKIALCKQLGIAETSTDEQVLAAIAAQKTAADKAVQELALARAQQPDLKTFVPRQDYELAIARVSALESSANAAKVAAHQVQVEAEIEGATRAGKITPATVAFYRSTCSTEEGLAIFREFVKVAPAIGAPSGLDARMPEGVGVASLSAEEKLIAANCGVSEDEMKKSKQELALATRNQVSRSRRAVETDDQD